MPPDWLLHLSPRACPWQEVYSHQLFIDPLPAMQTSGRDSFGNEIVHIELTTPHNYLRVDSTVELSVGADASHAWVAVFVPELGWVEFDPTNNCLADQRYLLLGWGRDFGDVSPIKGVIQGGGEHELAVGVTVTALDLG